MELPLEYNCNLCTEPWWNCSDIWLPSLCPHPPSFPPQQTRPTWLQTSLCCKIPCLIIQDQRLGSASRLSRCCIVHLTETLLGSFLSFNLFCPSFALPPHGCLPCLFKIFHFPPLCPLCSAHFAAASSYLSPLFLILLFWATSFLFFQNPPQISNIKTLTAVNAAAWNLAQEYNRKPAPRKEVKNCSSINLNRFSLNTAVLLLAIG